MPGHGLGLAFDQEPDPPDVRDIGARSERVMATPFPDVTPPPIWRAPFRP